MILALAEFALYVIRQIRCSLALYCMGSDLGLDSPVRQGVNLIYVYLNFFIHSREITITFL